MTAEQVRHARDLLTRPDNTVSSIARLPGVSRATIYSSAVSRESLGLDSTLGFFREGCCLSNIAGGVS